MNNYDIIKRPIVTEKTNKLREEKNKYVFEVHKAANKIQIKKAVEEVFKVTVLDVVTINVPSKPKRVGQHEGLTQAYKKAYVKLDPKDKIASFEV